MNLAVEVPVISSREVGIIVTEYPPIVPLVQIVIDERQIVFDNFSSAILPDFLTNPTRPRFATHFRKLVNYLDVLPTCLRRVPVSTQISIYHR